MGNIVKRIEDKTKDSFHMVEKVDGEWQRMSGEQYSISFDYGIVTQSTHALSSDSDKSFDLYKVKGDEQGTALFNFMSDNITGSSSMVEIGQIMTGVEGEMGIKNNIDYETIVSDNISRLLYGSV